MLVERHTQIDVTKAATANLSADAVLVADAEILLCTLVYVIMDVDCKAMPRTWGSVAGRGRTIVVMLRGRST